MNHQDSRNVTTKTFPPTALALVLGLALLLPGAAVLAGEPIPGVDIYLGKNPGGIPVIVPIDDSGKFSLRLKEPGSHTISTVCRQPGGCLPHKLSGTLKPGADGEPSIIGILIGLLLPAQKASADGTSYTFTVGDRGVVLSGQIPSAASVRVAAGDINGDGVETRKAGEPIKGGGPRPPPIVVPGTLAFTSANVDGNTPVNGIGGLGGGRFTFKPTSPVADSANAASSNRDHIDQDAQTDIRKRTAVQPGGPGNARIRISADVSTIRVQNYGIKATETAPGTDSGDGKLPGILRVINNSETDTATVEAINGVGGTGGGRFTFKPTSPVADSANAANSNRDHIDQDAQTDIKKRTAVQPDGPGNVRLRIPADVSTLRGTAPGGDERDVKLGTAAMANEPLTDGLMILRKNSGGITISTPTGADTEGIRPSLDVDRNNSTDPIVAAPKGGDKELPGLAGEPIPGIDVKLGSPGGNPGGNGVMATLNSSGATVAAETIASSRTDSQGNFHFGKLPAGNYVLILPDLPSQSLTVGADGIARGTVMRGSDGSMRIFDRWGKSFTAPPPKAGDAKQDTPDQTAGSKAAESPVGFGSGNHAMGAGPGTGLGAGPGMNLPGAAMGGLAGPGPVSPMGGGAGPMGAGGPMGGSGAMRP